MTAVISNQYTYRLATIEDAPAIAPLMAAFAQERMTVDSTMVIKPNYNFEAYVTHQLQKPFSCCWVLETVEPVAIVGFIFAYVYDETPPTGMPQDLLQLHELETPFLPRRVGSVLGLYVQPEHRQPETIKVLAEAAMQWAESMQVNDLDLLIGEDQTGIQALLLRLGFTRAAIQYTRHYSIPTDADLPSLHPPHPELETTAAPTPSAIPLRDPKTHELVRTPAGEPVFLCPLVDEKGDRLTTSDGLPIYPMPVRDPQTNTWLFDTAGNLVVCPLLFDESAQIVECEGVPQFYPPAYEIKSGQVRLSKNRDGSIIFCEVERDQSGRIVCSLAGVPVFRQPSLTTG